jgi:hypothetical protein
MDKLSCLPDPLPAGGIPVLSGHICLTRDQKEMTQCFQRDQTCGF